MRWLVLTLAAVLALPAAAGAQVAWAKAYEDGVEAFQKGNDALAEQKLIEATRSFARAEAVAEGQLFSSVVYRAVHPGLLPGRDLRRARAATSRRRNSSSARSATSW